MATRTTVLRNTGVFEQAKAQGQRVRFTYTTPNGEVKRRTVKPTSFANTRHNENALLVQGVDSLGNVRTFRTDRALRAVLVK